MHHELILKKEKKQWRVEEIFSKYEGVINFNQVNMCVKWVRASGEKKIMTEQVR